jgi:hypothetical protein
MPLATMHTGRVDASDPERVMAQAAQAFTGIRDRATQEHHQREHRAEMRRAERRRATAAPVPTPAPVVEDPGVTYARRLAALPQENEQEYISAQLALAFEFGHITQQEYITALQEIPQ